MEHEYKTFDFQVKEFDFDGRTVEGYAAAFGNIDLGSDIIHPGAFSKTLAERGGKVRFLWQHDTHEPIGKPIEMHEDDNGLFMKAIISDTTRGRDALALLKDNAINGLSIGYDAIPGGTDFSKNTGGETVRNLRELRLWEVSLVSMPMNENATITALKEDNKSINLTERVDSVRDAFRTQFNPNDGEFSSVPSPTENGNYYYVSTVFDDHLIVEDEGEDVYYSVGYVVDADGNYTFAPKSEWTPGEYIFIPTMKDADITLQRKQEALTIARNALSQIETMLADIAPAEDAGRVDDALNEGAGPDVQPPTSEDTERERLELLSQIETFEEV